MGLNQLGLIELDQDMGLIGDTAQIIKIKCEVKGFPRLRKYPVLIAVETEGSPSCGKIELSVSRNLVTAPVFISEKTQVAYVYAILLDSTNPCSEVIIKIVVSPDGEEGYCQPFHPQKDKVSFFGFEEELHLNQEEAIK